MKINALIVDDEKNAREVLRALLEKFCHNVNVVGEAPNVKVAHKMILELNPDLVFLDVQMPLSNGFSLLKKFDPVPFSVIFVTSYDHFAIHAIKFSAIDYLLKPVEIKELISSVEKAIAKKKEVNRYVINFLDNIEEDNSDKKIPIHVQGNVRFINTFSIMHIEADGVYANVFSDGEKFVSSKSLKDFEDFLIHNSSFIRINRAMLINLRHLKEYSKGDPFTLTLNNGTVFESSRRKKQEVLERLKIYS